MALNNTSVLTSQMITNEAAMILVNELNFAKKMARGVDDKFGNVEAQIGDFIDLRLPAQFTAVAGPTYSDGGYAESKVRLTLSNYTSVFCEFTDKDLTLGLGPFSDRVIRPAAEALANKIDRDALLACYQAIPNGYLATGSGTSLGYNDIVDAGQYLSDLAVPQDSKRAFIMDPRSVGNLAKDTKTIFNPGTPLGDQFTNGALGRAAGFDLEMDQNIYLHTVGNYSGTITTVTGTNNGTTTTIGGTGLIGFTAAAGTASATFLKTGDVFTIASVFEVNPVTKQSNGKLRKFVATADVVGTGSAPTTGNITFYPGCITSGNYQNVSAAPANGAAISIIGTAATGYKQQMAIHSDGFVMGMVPLIMPKNTDMAAVTTSKKLNVSIRFTRTWDAVNAKFINRFDTLYGFAARRPDFGVRMYTVPTA